MHKKITGISIIITRLDLNTLTHKEIADILMAMNTSGMKESTTEIIFSVKIGTMFN